MKIGRVICRIDGITIAWSMIKTGITLANDDMQGYLGKYIVYDMSVMLSIAVLLKTDVIHICSDFQMLLSGTCSKIWCYNAYLPINCDFLWRSFLKYIVLLKIVVKFLVIFKLYLWSLSLPQSCTKHLVITHSTAVAVYIDQIRHLQKLV